jgi:hypothetical protein
MIPLALIPALGSLIELVPNITKWITGSNQAGEVAEKVVSIAKQITGKDNADEAVSELRANPELLIAYKTAILDQAVELDKIAAQALETVNATMRVEAAADHWPTYGWRPFIGFNFGLYVLSLWLLPLFGKAPVIMSPDIVLAIGGILGVASWFRGKMQASPEIKSDNRG